MKVNFSLILYFPFSRDIQPHIPTLLEYFKNICVSIQPWKTFLENRKDSENKNSLPTTQFYLLQVNDSESENEDEVADLDSTEIGNRVMLDNDFYDIHHVGITDDSDDFIPVIPKPKRKGNLYSESCGYKFACTTGNRCEYRHTPEEKEFFKSSSNPKQRLLYKTKACYHIICKYANKSYMCAYAHSLEESRCLCCKQKGNGQHWMDKCPENNNNTN